MKLTIEFVFESIVDGNLHDQPLLEAINRYNDIQMIL